MEKSYQKHIKFDKNLFIIGFGSIGRAILPLIFRHIDIKPSQVFILTKKEDGAEIAKEYGVSFNLEPVTEENYQSLIDTRMKEGDFVLNLSVEVSSVDLIRKFQEKKILYLDTCIEPWAGGYTDFTLSVSCRSNYAMREEVLVLRKPGSKPGSTAVITHGANPGLITHFVKQALVNIAKDCELNISTPKSQEEWAMLAHNLGIKVIHVAERDTQMTNKPKRIGEFVNTWSIDGFIAEGSQPCEMGWGTHERHWPNDAAHHGFGPQCAIYLNRPGAATRVRTWTPRAGSFHGFLITHNESISISNYLTLKKDEVVHYRPTVHYAYHPCEDAVLSLYEYAGKEWEQQEQKRIIYEEIVDGVDELGALLMGNQKGAYWFGSLLSIHDARKLVPYNNATSLQVAIGALAGVIWAIEHPEAGIVEPEEIDFEYIMKIALPYLGDVSGHYTDWTPLKEREKLFVEDIDRSDPWQFINVRVT